ncbi:NYN domain-containing protein [Muricoccus nepalensis]|uniref:NYN domain-containing protein n=1 Tax=Muricoccus nepalensis TaxID=1854500 RepID=UPI0013868C1F|nr:NYN domain-containing protein [Roseomonas nepalensis]
MTHLAYVDVSNLFIEGQKVSAVAKGLVRDRKAASVRGVINFGYRLDLHRLMALLRQGGEGEGAPRAVAFGSVTNSNEGLWRHAAAAGFDVVTLERGFSGGEKRVDTSLVTRVCRDAYRFGDPRRDRITLAAGDGDYEPLVRQLVADGFRVTVLYWAHASRELREAATAFQSLDAYIEDLALG